MNHQRGGFLAIVFGYGPLKDGPNVNNTFLVLAMPCMVCNIIQWRH